MILIICDKFSSAISFKFLELSELCIYKILGYKYNTRPLDGVHMRFSETK